MTEGGDGLEDVLRREVSVACASLYELGGEAAWVEDAPGLSLQHQAPRCPLASRPCKGK